MTRIAVLVLSYDAQPWRTLETAGQRATWAHPSRRPPDIDVIWYQGDTSATTTRTARRLQRVARVPGLHPPAERRLVHHAVAHGEGRVARLDGDVLRLPLPDVNRTLTVKLHRALEWTLAHTDADLVWRTNSSTFTHLPTMARLVEALPRHGLYAGYPGPRATGDHRRQFASGTGILMSRDVVERLVASQALHTTVVDDVAVARACAQMGVPLVPLQRLEVNTLDAARSIDPAELADCAFVRCFSGSRRRAAIEPAMMAAVQSAYDTVG